ncbi:MAG: hypothetical protein V3W18_07810 [candidate division Zixibacteria bacterium]
MDTFTLAKRYLNSISQFVGEAHKILSIQESSTSRVIVLDKTYKQLAVLSLKQDELIRQALRCVENKLYRASHVIAWAAIMDFIEEKISTNGLKELTMIRPKWKTSSLEELREYHSEYQIIEAGRDLSLYGKNMCKALLGFLNTRNECAHPSNYYPDMNETLGYISNILNRIKMISKNL